MSSGYFTMSAASIALLIVIGFFVGSVPFGVLVSQLFYRTDIRQSGSGNIGAANALRTLGKRGAIAVLLLDAFKGFAPTYATYVLAGPALATVVAFAAMLGHCYSPFLRFRGGKGVATFLGTLVALWPWAALIFAIVWIAAVLAFGYASVASMTATVAMIPTLGLGYADRRIGLLYGIAASALIVYAHRENLGRLRSGTENRFSLLKARRT